MKSKLFPEDQDPELVSNNRAFDDPQLHPWNRSIVFSDNNIKIIEEHYDCLFVGDFPLPLKGGGWGKPGAVFWQKEIPEKYQNDPTASKYVVLYSIAFEKVWVTSGKYLEGRIFTGIKSRDGEIIHSRHIHDYRPSKDGSCAIDGGFDYLRRTGQGTVVSLRLQEDKIVEVDLIKVGKDGDQMYALLGPNIQEGEVEFVEIMKMAGVGINQKQLEKEAAQKSGG